MDISNNLYFLFQSNALHLPIHIRDNSDLFLLGRVVEISSVYTGNLLSKDYTIIPSTKMSEPDFALITHFETKNELNYPVVVYARYYPLLINPDDELLLILNLLGIGYTVLHRSSDVYRAFNEHINSVCNQAR